MNSKVKGNEGEREILHLLEGRQIPAFRNEQMYIGGYENPDISALIAGQRFHIEVKRREKLSVYQAMGQAEHDCGGIAIPMVAYRKNRGKWLAIVSLQDFLNLMERGEKNAQGSGQKR